MKKLLLFLGSVLLLAQPVTRGEAPQPEAGMSTTTTEYNPFSRGAWEFQNVTGAFFFFDRGGNDRPSIDYAVTSFRFGYVWTHVHFEHTIFAGSFEFLGEAFAGGVFNGPGNVLTGPTLLYRWNFVQPQARIVPYLQIGTGLVYTDIGTKESGGLISLPVEFNLQGTSGFRYMLNDRWSLVIEATYRHVSNATIKLPNYGLDNLGGDLGFGFSF